MKKLLRPDGLQVKSVTKDMLPYAQSLTDDDNLLQKTGLRWILAGMAILLLTTLWPVIYHLGIPLSRTLTARLGGTAGTLALFVGVIIFVRAVRPHGLLTPSQRFSIILWRALLLLFLTVGIILGNSVVSAGREFLFLWMLAEFLVAGVDDRFWFAIEKPLTVVFYVAVPFIFTYYETPMLLVDPLGVYSHNVGQEGGRYTWSLAYQLRPLINFGLFLGVWGFVRPNGGIWRMAQMIAPIPYFIIDVGLFQFRSVVFLLAVVVVSLLIFRPLLESRRRPAATAILLAVCVGGLLIFVDSERYDVFKKRSFEETAKESIFQSRLDELTAYQDDMGWEILVGRGLGGSFDASAVFSKHQASEEWGGVHFGILLFTLKGGVLLFVVFVAFMGRGFQLRPKAWYGNPCNLAAALFFPVIVIQLVLNPISATPVALFKFLPVMMVLARFGRRDDIVGKPMLQSAVFPATRLKAGAKLVMSDGKAVDSLPVVGN